MRIYDDTPDGRYCNIRVLAESGNGRNDNGSQGSRCLNT